LLSDGGISYHWSLSLNCSPRIVTSSGFEAFNNEGEGPPPPIPVATTGEHVPALQREKRVREGGRGPNKTTAKKIWLFS
jgi:hypothetical protein